MLTCIVGTEHIIFDVLIGTETCVQEAFTRPPRIAGWVEMAFSTKDVKALVLMKSSLLSETHTARK